MQTLDQQLVQTLDQQLVQTLDQQLVQTLDRAISADTRNTRVVSCDSYPRAANCAAYVAILNWYCDLNLNSKIEVGNLVAGIRRWPLHFLLLATTIITISES